MLDGRIMLVDLCEKSILKFVRLMCLQIQSFFFCSIID